MVVPPGSREAGQRPAGSPVIWSPWPPLTNLKIGTNKINVYSVVHTPELSHLKLGNIILATLTPGLTGLRGEL